MIKRIITFVLILLASMSIVYAGQGDLKGKVKDGETGERLIGANVVLKGTNLGAATDENGNFSITKIPEGEYRVLVTFIGYTSTSREVIIVENETKEIEVVLEKSSILSEQIVITASKKPEKLTEAPASIDVINAKELENFAGFNSGELLARQKGVDYVRTGVLGTGINIRGFNSAFNPKNLQMNDNRLSTLVATGLPLGALSTVIKEDIERVEIILGPAAALYGPNAHNGLVNTISKDPRTSQGTSLSLTSGNQSVFSGRFRHAQVVNDKLSFKISGEYSKGIEFDYADTVYVGTKGYTELDLDRKFNSLRGEAGLYYNLDNSSDVILTYGHSLSNNIGVTSAGRNQIKDWQIDFLQGRYVAEHLFAQVYYTWSKTTDTYAMNQRTQNYISFKNAGFTDSEARSRSYKEAWSGTQAAGKALPRGAVFEDASKRLNAEVQYNETFGNLNLIAGAQWQRDNANSNNTYLLEKSGAIILNQYGFSAQAEYEIENSGFKILAAARGDNHELYGFNFIPKGGVVYSSGVGTFRATYGKGIASPTILNLSGNLFGGLVLGDGEGFTLSDGSQIPKLKVETINSFEVGYKGIMDNKLLVDVNAYYNTSENFLSPLVNIATLGRKVIKRGDTPIQDIIPGTPSTGSAFLLTYLNFGKVNTYGADIGLNYYLNETVDFVFNYSYFNFKLDKGDLQNDGDKSGKVTDTDLPINTPKNKLGFGVNVNYQNFFGTVFTRWVQKYNFFSGINVAAATDTNIVISGTKVIENARVGRGWNYGPLGGFVNIDLSAGYKFNKNIALSVQVTNLFDTKEREFVASPFISRLF
ncbi:MAG: TonB-dependent receptor, partial [Ignavibacteriaceae bacterium]